MRGRGHKESGETLDLHILSGHTRWMSGREDQISVPVALEEGGCRDEPALEAMW
jgi:hypothetical protein